MEMNIVLPRPASLFAENATIGVKLPYKKSDLVLGCILSITGNLLISISLNVQKFVHIKNSRLETPTHYSRLPLWWLGLMLMILGEVGNFIAFGLAPASMIAPLATTTVIANMVIAVVFLKERLRPEDIFGTTMALIGACLIVNFSSKNQSLITSQHLTMLTISKVFLVYFVIEFIILIALLVMYYHFHYDHLLVLLGICNIIASVTVITAKGVSSLITLTLKGNNQFLYYNIYVYTILLLSTGVLQVIYLNKAMQLYYSTVVVPTNFVFFTITAITAGVVFYREFSGLDSLQIFMFLFGCTLSCIGVYFIQLNRVTPEEKAKSESSSISALSSTDDNQTERKLSRSKSVLSTEPIKNQSQETPTKSLLANQIVTTNAQLPTTE